MPEAKLVEEGLYAIFFGNVAQGVSGGVVVLETGKFLGGDSVYTYSGTFEVEAGDKFRAKGKVISHVPGAQDALNAFGDNASEFDIMLLGSFADNAIDGVMVRLDKSDVTLPVRLVLRKRLH